MDLETWVRLYNMVEATEPGVVVGVALAWEHGAVLVVDCGAYWDCWIDEDGQWQAD